jgi:hypothetical protein
VASVLSGLCGAQSDRQPGEPVTSTDWSDWHDAYSRAGSGLAERLAAVCAQIDRHLDLTAPEPVRVISACAGDGRDLLSVLSKRPDADRVTAFLVEYDAELAARARRAAEALPARIEVLQADAAQGDVYTHLVPADLVLLCGIFGNVSDADVRATIQAASQLCAPGAKLIWTRHRADPDLTPSIREWFAEAGFEEVTFLAPHEHQWSVGVHRLVAEPMALESSGHWFTFFR